MNAHELSVLRAVVEQRGFSRAAKVAHLSQSAVSQAIRRLEEEVGAPLLERGRPPQLTEAGRHLYDHAVDVLERGDLVRRQIRELEKGQAGIVVLAASQALSRDPLPALVARFTHTHPTAGFELQTLPSRQIIVAVADGRVELGLGPFARAMAGLTTLALGKQRMVLYAGKKHPRLRPLQREGTSALSREALVTSHLEVSASTKRRGLLREHFGSVWVVQSLDLRISLVRDGLALGYLPERTVTEAGLKRELVPLRELPFGAIERTYGLFFSTRRATSKLGEAFCASARTHLGK